MDFLNKINPFKKEEAPSSQIKSSPGPSTNVPGFLGTLADNKTEFETVLTNIKKISPDSYIYTYSLPNPDLPLGLRPGHHVVVYGTANGERVKREYTPISDFHRKGTFDLLVKIYRAGVHPDFPNGGRLTQFLETKKVGDKVIMSGPKFKKTYLGHGKFDWRGAEINVKEVGMIAGGTGIAPMYQVIRNILDDPTDQTKLHLLFANRSEADILIKEELEEAAKDPRIKVHYVVDQGSAGWKGFTGFITKEMLQKTMPGIDKNAVLWGCGPKPMQRLVKSQLQDLGYNMDLVFM